MNIAAIFDVDKTILEGQSQHILTKYLYRNKKISFMTLSYISAYFLLYNIGFMNDLTNAREKIYNKIIDRWNKKDFEILCKECFEKYVKQKLFKEALDCIAEHKSKGHTIILLSAAISEIIEPISVYVGSDYFYATQLKSVNSIYTGKIEGEPVYGQHKKELLSVIAAKHNIDLINSFFYTDSFSDMPIYQIIKNFVAVNPDRSLMSFSVKNNLRITKYIDTVGTT